MNFIGFRKPPFCFKNGLTLKWSHFELLSVKLLSFSEQNVSIFTNRSSFVRSSRPEVLCVKGVLKISQYSQKSTCVGVSF